MELNPTFLSKKFEYLYKVEGDTKTHSFALNHLMEETNASQIGQIAEAIQPLVNGEMSRVRITDVSVTI